MLLYGNKESLATTKLKSHIYKLPSFLHLASLLPKSTKSGQFFFPFMILMMRDSKLDNGIYKIQNSDGSTQ